MLACNMAQKMFPKPNWLSRAAEMVVAILVGEPMLVNVVQLVKERKAAVKEAEPMLVEVLQLGKL